MTDLVGELLGEFHLVDHRPQVENLTLFENFVQPHSDCRSPWYQQGAGHRGPRRANLRALLLNRPVLDIDYLLSDPHSDRPVDCSASSFFCWVPKQAGARAQKDHDLRRL